MLDGEFDLSPYREWRKQSKYIDSIFQFRGRVLGTGHRVVLASCSPLWDQYFSSNEAPRAEIHVPFDLHKQFTTLIDFCYDPTIKLPSAPTELFALFFIATVYRINGLIEAVSVAFPIFTPEIAFQFIETEYAAENVSITRTTFNDFPMLQSGIDAMISTVGPVLPFVVDNLPMIPFPRLCQTVSAEVIRGIAEFPVEEPNDVHSVISQFVRDHPIDRESTAWRNGLLAALQIDQEERDAAMQIDQEERDANDSAGTFVVPLPQPSFPPPPTYPIPIIPTEGTRETAPAAPRKVHSRKRVGLRNLQPAEYLPPHVIASAALFAFALLINGGQFAQQKQILAWLNIQVPGKTAFYRAQAAVCEKLVTWAYESCARWKACMGDESAISFDGSWSQRRKALHCFAAFIDPSLRKVVDFDVVERDQGAYKGNFQGTSQAMETEILKLMGTRWAGNDKVKWFCHDKDNHAMTVLANELHWLLEEKLDCNHIVKTWQKRFDEYEMMDPETIDPSKKKRRVNALGELHGKLLRWFYVVLRTDGTLGEKERLWRGAYNHYVNGPVKEDGFHWSKRADPRSRTRLQLFLDRTIDLIPLFQTEISTQLNESLHAMKAKLADKGYAWKGSWKARCAVAILNINEGHQWKLRLYEECGFPTLSPECMGAIVRHAAEARELSIQRREAAYQESTRNHRLQTKMDQQQLAAAAKRCRTALHK
jgi:hypothetical protein